MSSAPRNAGHWFGPADRPLMGWLSWSGDETPSSGVVVAPPIGYPYWSSHRTLRVLAERLADQGHLALRLDYDATGDSAGDQSDPDRVDAWRASIAEAVAELRGQGCTTVSVVGVRLGALLALIDGADLGADALVAWSPVLSGRRHGREIRLLSEPVPLLATGDPDPQDPQDLAAAGVLFSATTLTELSALTIEAITAAPARRVLIVDDAPTKLATALASLGSEVTTHPAAGSETALEAPTEEATVPGALVDAIATWVGSSTAPASRAVELRPTATWTTTDGTLVRESVVTLGPSELVGVLTDTPTTGPEATTVVFLNTGSETHVGSGRAWVEYARALAARGHRAVRVDFRGWGESPHGDGLAPGRPYDAHAIDDAVEVLEALRRAGHPRVVLCGLCASAWVALRAALQARPDAVIALNPQMYWQPGDPIETTMAEGRRRRAAEIEHIERGARRGAWTALDLLGHRPWAGRWLDQLTARGLPVFLVFAEGDDGMVYLRTRLARRLGRAQRRGTITIVEIPDIDHSMHRFWLRERMIDALDRCLTSLPEPAEPALPSRSAGAG